MGQLRIIQKEELQQHQTKSSCWVVHQHHVYDITSFLPDHPGGPELILEHLHQNMTQAMNNALIHEHSESAYTLLSPFVIGVYEGASSSDTPLPLTQDFLLNPLVETEASLSLSSSDSLYS
ncbi:fatty acid alpha-hydroxylase, partial [Coelomomyces lativittatus]